MEYVQPEQVVTWLPRSLNDASLPGAWWAFRCWRKPARRARTSGRCPCLVSASSESKALLRRKAQMYVLLLKIHIMVNREYLG